MNIFQNKMKYLKLKPNQLYLNILDLFKISKELKFLLSIKLHNLLHDQEAFLNPLMILSSLPDFIFLNISKLITIYFLLIFHHNYQMFNTKINKMPNKNIPTKA